MKLLLENPHMTLQLQVAQGTDIEDTFNGICLDTGETLYNVKPWLFTITILED